MTNAGCTSVGHVRRPAGSSSDAASAIGVAAGARAFVRQHVGARAQVLDERQLERARPRPQLAHRQRRDRLEGGDEPVQALRVETAGAAADQLEGQRIDARQSGEFVGRDPGQPPIERGRQIVADVAGGGRDDVEVVEQPLGGGRRLLAAPRVVGQGDIHVPQRVHVAVESPQVGAPFARPRWRP